MANYKHSLLIILLIANLNGLAGEVGVIFPCIEKSDDILKGFSVSRDASFDSSHVLATLEESDFLVDLTAKHLSYPVHGDTAVETEFYSGNSPLYVEKEVFLLSVQAGNGNEADSTGSSGLYSLFRGMCSGFSYYVNKVADYSRGSLFRGSGEGGDEPPDDNNSYERLPNDKPSDLEIFLAMLHGMLSQVVITGVKTPGKYRAIGAICLSLGGRGAVPLQSGSLLQLRPLFTSTSYPALKHTTPVALLTDLHRSFTTGVLSSQRFSSGDSFGCKLVSQKISQDNYVELFTDGACKGNPGPGGWGVLIRRGIDEKEIYGGETNTTNNRMELLAVIEGLLVLETNCMVWLTTDSEYVYKGATKWMKEWKKHGWVKRSGDRVKNQKLWKKLYELNKYHSIQWILVKGHSGNRENDIADRLAQQGAEDNSNE